MNLFDKLVTEALQHQPALSPLRIVVEKELLHHDILRIMRDNNLITSLTFIGGTSLRCCYGSVRLSEDLDFTGGSNFSRTQLSSMGTMIIKDLQGKYGLQITVSEPIKDKQNVDTWRIKIITRPEAKHLPTQLINIDICAVPSYERRPMLLLNPYGVDMGTSGLIVQVQSREEIYADKLLAFAFRPNRIKYRDLWDIMWLHGQGFKPRITLIPHKLKDRQHTLDFFSKSFKERLKTLKEHSAMATEFTQEMRRFLPVAQINTTLEQENLWQCLIDLMDDLDRQMHHSII